MISLDTETTGLDFKHGAKPFFVTTCTEDGTVRYWEWEVDPLTREPRIPEEDAREIRQLLAVQDEIVGHNIKFDAHQLLAGRVSDWTPLWELTHDTLIASHILASNQPHNLTDLAIHYLGRDIEPLEKALEEVVQKARRYCRSHHKNWAIASAGRSNMPSAKEKMWKYDTWLPAVLCRINEGEDGWETVLREYANMDSAVTVLLWQVLKAELHRRGLWSIYVERMKLVPIVYDMEERGITLSPSRLEELERKLGSEGEASGKVCVEIAAEFGAKLTLPKAGNNGSLMSACFDHIKLPVYKSSLKTGRPSLDKETMDAYLARLEAGPQLDFVKALAGKRKRDTALSYLESYQKFWIPGEEYKVYPSMNITGTDTLRFSMQCPNSSQVSKKEDVNLRYVFGPDPGREWWCLDYENIELRIPSYESGEKALIELFERPDDAPYFGSQHLLYFDLLHPEKFREHGAAVKKVFADTWYQWTKNGDFAIQYGAQEATSDRAYHVEGAYTKIKSRFAKLEQLNQACIAYANEHGYIETIPDREVNPEHGYPLMCTRTEYGRVLPTVPLNYRTQGTAMQCTAKAMVRTDTQCKDWTSSDPRGYYLLIQVHDELVFDFPRGEDYTTNLPKVRKLKRLMEQSGDDIGIPLRVAMSYHPETWAKGAAIK